MPTTQHNSNTILEKYWRKLNCLVGLQRTKKSSTVNSRIIKIFHHFSQTKFTNKGISINRNHDISRQVKHSNEYLNVMLNCNVL